MQVVPNGVDLELFEPDGEALPLADAPGLRFLFVGGLIQRKGPDVLLAAWRAAFAGRDDVTLVVKDFGAGGVYARADRSELRAYAESGELPRLVLIDDELSDDEMAALYRACDVFVHPYRGEGFGMPVLEAMACGLPTIVTAGGPTGEFCPDDACWRIPSTRRSFPEPRVGDLETVGLPWQLEPDAEALAELLQTAASDQAARAARGAVGAEAARGLSWDEIARRYANRIAALGGRAQAGASDLLDGAPGGVLDVATVPRPRLIASPTAEVDFEEQVDLRVLAAPAWRAEDDRLAELLDAWATAAPAGTSACLYLLVGSAADGEPHELLERTAAAAARAGVDLDAAADVTLLAPPLPADHDRELHAAVDAYVELPGAAPGHLRAARAAGNPVLEPAARSLAAWIERAPLPTT